MSVEQKLFDALTLEIAALKAQIGLIQKKNIDLLNSNRGFEYSCGLDRLFDAINKTPPQCLKDIKAESFKEGVTHMGCYLVDNHEDNFVGGKVQISSICDVVVEDYDEIKE